MLLYFIKYGKILKGEFVSESKRGTGAWLKVEWKKKNVLVSYSKCFKTEEEAQRELNEIIRRKHHKEAVRHKKFMENQKEIEYVMEKIYREFGIEVKCLNKPVLKEDAWRFYYRLKKDYKSLK